MRACLVIILWLAGCGSSPPAVDAALDGPADGPPADSALETPGGCMLTCAGSNTRCSCLTQCNGHNYVVQCEPDGSCACSMDNTVVSTTTLSSCVGENAAIPAYYGCGFP